MTELESFETASLSKGEMMIVSQSDFLVVKITEVIRHYRHHSTPP